jgi:hypothetical protein
LLLLFLGAGAGAVLTNCSVYLDDLSGGARDASIEGLNAGGNAGSATAGAAGSDDASDRMDGAGGLATGGTAGAAAGRAGSGGSGGVDLDAAAGAAGNGGVGKDGSAGTGGIAGAGGTDGGREPDATAGSAGMDGAGGFAGTGSGGQSGTAGSGPAGSSGTSGSGGSDAGGDAIVVDALGDAVTPDAVALCQGGECKRLFVSSAPPPGAANLGGLSGADAFCQSAANAKQLGGSWKAWLSDATTSASARLTHATVPYVLLDRSTVAANWTALTSGTLAHTINVSEDGVVRTDVLEVWTASTAQGAYSGRSCSAWTSNAPGANTADVGLSNQTDAEWTNRYQQYCDRTNVHLYCIEQ